MLEAETAELDLVEVSPNTDPPVCKIVDYGKLLYNQQKKNKKQTKKIDEFLKEMEDCKG